MVQVHMIISALMPSADQSVLENSSSHPAATVPCLRIGLQSVGNSFQRRKMFHCKDVRCGFEGVLFPNCQRRLSQAHVHMSKGHARHMHGMGSLWITKSVHFHIGCLCMPGCLCLRSLGPLHG